MDQAQPEPQAEAEDDPQGAITAEPWWDEQCELNLDRLARGERPVAHGFAIR